MLSNPLRMLIGWLLASVELFSPEKQSSVGTQTILARTVHSAMRMKIFWRFVFVISVITCYRAGTNSLLSWSRFQEWTKNNYYKRRKLGLEKKSTKYMNSHKMIERIIGGIILINLLSTKSVSVVVKEDYRKVKDKKKNVDDCQFARLPVQI